MRNLLLIVSLILAGCVSGSSSDNDPSEPDVQATDNAVLAQDVVVDTAEPFNPDDWSTYEAGPFTVPAGEERYYCFSHVLTEELWVDEIRLDSRPVVHHVIYAKAGGSDPDGFYECDVLFKNNWVPLFVAGTGDASLIMPEGAGHVLQKGTQLTLQLHLVNATLEEVTETIPIHLHKMAEAPAEPVEVVVFGTLNIALPAGQASEAVSDCPSGSDMEIFSVFPHMHLLGRSMVVETGPSPDNLQEVFRREPYDFDDQFLSPLDLSIKAGDTVRVTCGYDNTLDQMVTFGESTTNEMCFFIGFATGAAHELAGCIGGDGGGLVPEGCGEDPPNELGLGATCSKGGDECEAGLLCTEDIEQIEGLDLCIGLGCTGQSDCGEGGVCCSIEAAGGVTLCLPPSCVFPVCEILE